jgi:hypothetical protein
MPTVVDRVLAASTEGAGEPEPVVDRALTIGRLAGRLLLLHGPSRREPVRHDEVLGAGTGQYL